MIINKKSPARNCGAFFQPNVYSFLETFFLFCKKFPFQKTPIYTIIMKRLSFLLAFLFLATGFSLSGQTPEVIQKLDAYYE